MDPIFDFIFNEWIVGLGVPIMIGVGFALLADEFKEYRGARVTFWISAIWLWGKVTMWTVVSSKSFQVRALIVFLVAGIVAVGLTEALRLVNKRQTPTDVVVPPPPPPQLAPVALFLDCQLVGLPAKVLPETSIFIVGLNKKRMASKDTTSWGLYEIPNRTDKVVYWPSKTKLQQHVSLKGEHTGLFGYKCDLTNHSEVTLLNVSIDLRIWFGNKGGEENVVHFTTILSPLDAGALFTFYVVNDCPVVANLVLPDEARVQVVGEDTRRSVALNRPNRNPMEPIMIFFPSHTQWVGETPCE